MHIDSVLAYYHSRHRCIIIKILNKDYLKFNTIFKEFQNILENTAFLMKNDVWEFINLLNQSVLLNIKFLKDNFEHKYGIAFPNNCKTK